MAMPEKNRKYINTTTEFIDNLLAYNCVVLKDVCMRNKFN